MYLRLRHAWQRLTRGYDDTLYWNFDAWLAEHAIVFLKHMKKRELAPPTNVDTEKTVEEIDRMIAMFTKIESGDEIDIEIGDTTKEVVAKHAEWEAEYNEAMDLFKKHLPTMWT